MSALIKATTSFVTEKLIIQRERRSGAYSVAPYFFSKLLAEVPLSAFFPCMTGFIIYKLCGLNPAPGRLAKFLGILTVESFASSGTSTVSMRVLYYRYTKVLSRCYLSDKYTTKARTARFAYSRVYLNLVVASMLFL
jgi:hypothetical protein